MRSVHAPSVARLTPPAHTGVITQGVVSGSRRAQRRWRLTRGSGVLHGAVQLVEIPGRETAQEHLAKPWPDRRLDLCPVGPEGGRVEVEPFALFEPLVEELTEGRSDPI